MEYGKILKRAWDITWKYKFLWVFGFVMALCRGGSSFNQNFNFRGSSRRDFNYNPPSLGQLHQFQAYLPQPWGQVSPWIYIGAILVFILVVFLVAVAVMSITRGSLVKTVERIEAGELVTFKSAWQDGKSNFSRLFGFQFVISIPGLILALSFIGIMLAFVITAWIKTQGGQLDFSAAFWELVPLFVASICGYVLVALVIQILVSILETFGSRAIILESNSFRAAFGRGWQVFRSNIGATIILALILFVLGVGVGLILLVPVVLVMIGLVALLLPVFIFAKGMSALLVVLAILGILVIALLTLAIRGVFLVYLETSWTLAYREMMAKLTPQVENSLAPAA